MIEKLRIAALEKETGPRFGTPFCEMSFAIA